MIAVDQHSTRNHLVISTDKAVVWLADSGTKDAQYLAVFNISEASTALAFRWQDLGLNGKTYQLRDLWEHKDLPFATSLAVTLPSHASVLYRISPVREGVH